MGGDASGMSASGEFVDASGELLRVGDECVDGSDDGRDVC